MKDTKYLRAIGGIDDKLIERAAGKSTVKVITFAPWLKRLAPVAACAAIALFCVWAIPNLFNNSVDNLGGGDTNLLTPHQPDITAEPPHYALTLNRVDEQTGALRMFIDGHFWHDLTDAQLDAVLPKFDFPVTATAHYEGTGRLFEVVVHETADGEPAIYGEFFTRTEIKIAPGEVFRCYLFNYEPIESEVFGIPVIAGVFDMDWHDGVAMYVAEFKLDGIAYEIKLHDSDTGDSGLNRLTALVNEIIRNGAADLSVLDNPVIPELRDDQLTLDEARNDPDFGAFIPENIPAGLRFESANRFINQTSNNLRVLWHSAPNWGMDSLTWQISRVTEHDLARVVSPEELEKYEMSLYSIPFFESVPEELWETVQNPVFLADELTLDVIRARVLQAENNRAGTASYRMNPFSVLYGDVVVEVSANGLTPEQIWNMITEADSASQLALTPEISGGTPLAPESFVLPRDMVYPNTERSDNSARRTVNAEVALASDRNQNTPEPEIDVNVQAMPIVETQSEVEPAPEISGGTPLAPVNKFPAE